MKHRKIFAFALLWLGAFWGPLAKGAFNVSEGKIFDVNEEETLDIQVGGTDFDRVHVTKLPLGATWDEEKFCPNLYPRWSIIDSAIAWR